MGRVAEVREGGQEAEGNADREKRMCKIPGGVGQHGRLGDRA